MLHPPRPTPPPTSQGGCNVAGSDIPPLEDRQCLLMDAANGTRVPPVARRGVAAEAVGGFPVRAEPLTGLPGMVLRTAQGMVGGDFECGFSSLTPGVCALRSAPLAAAACANAYADTCQAVVVFPDGNGGELAVLKSSNLAPGNAFMSPDVYTLERVAGAQVRGRGCAVCVESKRARCPWRSGLSHTYLRTVCLLLPPDWRLLAAQ